MTKSNIRNHAYQFEHTLQQSADYKHVSVHKISNNSTWLVFMGNKWIPFDSTNQHKLEQTLGLGGTFVDIEDKLFPAVKRVRVFPKSNYLSYLGVKYRLSRVMQPYQFEFGAQSSQLNINNEDEKNDPALYRIQQPVQVYSDNNVSFSTRVS